MADHRALAADAGPFAPAGAAGPLDRLRAAFPAFRISREYYGRHGTCWVARRIDRTGSGPHLVITSDLREFRAALSSTLTRPRLP